MSRPIKVILVLVIVAVLAALMAVGVIVVKSSRESGAKTAAAPQPAISTPEASEPPKVRLNRTKPARPQAAAITDTVVENVLTPEVSAQPSPSATSAAPAVSVKTGESSPRLLYVTVNGRRVAIDPSLPQIHFSIRCLNLTPPQQAAIDIIDARFRPLVQQQESQSQLKSLQEKLRAAIASGDQRIIDAATTELTAEQGRAVQMRGELDKQYLDAVKPVLTAEQLQTLESDKYGKGG